MFTDQRKTINDQPIKAISRFWAIALSGLLLASCDTFYSTVEQTGSAVDDIVQTASGRLTEVKHRAADKIQPIVETVNDVNRRVDDVQKGIEKAKEAKDLLDGALE